ncbi:hypothetical protein OOJ09_27890 [Mesorhizobium qingshengii]|uniref:Integral membrane bound transporter domain-containing protein n=1 Tax=Mesorhizobium qingshengii TaxID=1165689 RepID=A0ABT4R2G1_9HYPH|nr:FUSC family protein [Mesorhizobium qingshengii]MCZ8548015.1 hypothetical protein [Mesorhizobium qingshengii]
MYPEDHGGCIDGESAITASVAMPLGVVRCPLRLLGFEMCVIRNYALAVVFITAAALTIASGGHPVPDAGHLLWVRGNDTFIGCATGLGVLLLTPRTVAVRIPRELVDTLAALKTTLGHAVEGAVTTSAARQARRDLQHRTIAPLQAYDASSGASLRPRDAAGRMWPAVVVAQRLAYGPDGDREVNHALAMLSDAICGETKPAPLSLLPEFLGTEMRNLRDSLVYEGTRVARQP